MATRLEEIEGDLELYTNARAAILQGAQSYSKNGVSLTRADLKSVEDSIRRLRAERDAIKNGFDGASGIVCVEMGGFR